VRPLDFRHPIQPRLVSCIVPVFNGERYVAETIESILGQTHIPIEIIVVDDGSTDRTQEVLRPFGDGIRVLTQENQGPSGARNHGLEESRGEFIAFLDADDLWIPEKLELQLERMDGQPGLDLCSGHIKSFWIPELDHERAQFEDHPYHQSRALLSPCTVLTRREIFERVGRFDPELRNGEDTDWFMRAMKLGVAMETLPDLLVHRRQHLNNLTRAARPSTDAVLELLKRTLDRGRSG
jgi:glycosyltransferase involved in cell wall biosynthesis